MDRRALVLVLAVLLPASGPEEERDRSPSDLALTPDGRWAITANTTSGTASLVDLKDGKVSAEVRVGERPLSVAVSRKGDLALVTNWLSDSVTLLRVSPPRLEVSATFSVGDEPRGAVFAPDGRRAYVALSGDGSVAIVDVSTRTVQTCVPAGDEPWHLALSPDGGRLAVGSALSGDVRIIHTKSLRVLRTLDTYGRNLRHFAASSDGRWAYLPHTEERGRSTTKAHIDQGWVVGSRLSRFPLAKKGPREAIALDPQGRAIGDVDGIAVGPDGNTIALTAGGTHEVVLLRLPLPFVSFGGPGDHIEPELLEDARRLRRVEVGGRPLGVAFSPDGKRIVVANYLRNSVQVVDFAAGKLAGEVSLGGPKEPSLARRGEAIFYDAKRSFSQWYSCHTCHVDGHTNGSIFDTKNDGKYGTYKKALSLRGVSKTGPWTWHGRHGDLRASVRSSLTTTLRGPEPTKDDLDALLAFLDTIDFVPPPGRPEEEKSVRRGQALFRRKACDACHVPPDYTTDEIFLVGLEDYGDPFRGFNPPSLRGVGRRSPYLHDGRAITLEQVFKYYHRPKKLNGKPDFTEAELKDLIAFLNSL